MYQIGDLIVYGSPGVCRVTDITTPDIRGTENKLYYVLAPLYQDGIIYTPVESKVFMRPIITKVQAEELIDKIPEINSPGFEGRDRKETVENYKLSIGTHECEDLVKLIKAVYSKTRNLVNCGKKPGQTDTQYLKQAETLLHSELSVALGIPLAEVPEYIASKVSNR